MKNVFAVLATLMLLFFASQVQAQQCTTDSDCPGALCYASACTRISEFESLLKVETEQWVDGTALYIDGTHMGTLPWEGIISAGYHQIRVEASGYEPLVLNGTNQAGGREVIRARLVPSGQQAQVYPPQQQVSPYQSQPDQSPWVPKRFFAGLALSGGIGTAKWGDSTKRPAFMTRIGLLAGARLTKDTSKAWLDLGLRLDYGAMTIQDWPDQGEIPGGYLRKWQLFIGAVPRLMFPIKAGRFYLGAESEIAVVVSSRTWGYLALRGDMSIIIKDWIELQINPLGIEYFQDVYLKGMIVGYNASAAFVIRFP